MVTPTTPTPLEQLGALFGGFSAIKCEKCNRTFYWGTAENPHDLVGRLRDHICWHDLPEDVARAKLDDFYRSRGLEPLNTPWSRVEEVAKKLYPTLVLISFEDLGQQYTFVVKLVYNSTDGSKLETMATLRTTLNGEVIAVNYSSK